MRVSQLMMTALAASLGGASPILKRQAATEVDLKVLNYALTLEFLERKFYQEGLAKFCQEAFVEAGFPDPFFYNLQAIAADEETHVDVLTKVIIAAEGVPVKEASYSFPITDVQSFITLSSILEGVGVSAYLGAAGSLVDKNFLVAAGSILTVEARHSSYIRNAIGQSPFPAPFDTPLDFNPVFSLAAMFITGFAAGDAPLPFKAFPPLTLGCTEFPYQSGNSSVTLKDAATLYPSTNGAPLFAAFFSGLTPFIIPVHTVGQDYRIDHIPHSISGQTYVVLTNDAAKATDETIIAGPAILEVLQQGRIPTEPKGRC